MINKNKGIFTETGSPFFSVLTGAPMVRGRQFPLITGKVITGMRGL